MLEQMRIIVSPAVKPSPSGGSPGCIHCDWPLRRMPLASRSPANEKASETRKIHIPIFPGVAIPYCASAGQMTAACAPPSPVGEWLTGARIVPFINYVNGESLLRSAVSVARRGGARREHHGSTLRDA